MSAETIQAELRRKGVHVGLCFALYACFLLIGARAFRIILSVGMLSYILLELLRVRGYAGQLWASMAWSLSRPSERGGARDTRFPFLLSPLLLALGLGLASMLPHPYFFAAVLAMSIGDSLATLVGLAVPRGAYMSKHLSGTLAAGIAVGLLLLFFGAIAPSLYSLPLVMVALVALFIMLVDMLPLQAWDNIVLPLLIAASYFLVHAL